MATGCAGGVIGVAAMESTLPKPQETALQRTVLFDLHERLGAKIVPFAGYEMPVQYPAGIMQEHLHTRAAAGLFDVSHMGQAWLDPLDEAEDAASLFEALVPGGIATLAEGRIRYTQLTNPQGGILDDLMATRFGNRLWLVVNAACKESDFAHIETALAGRARLRVQARALLALQGPQAVNVLARFLPDCRALTFMQAAWMVFDGEEVLVSRCGYTGEDGFEISVPEAQAVAFAERLLGEDEVAPIGLGARDSLRLEAGLCLYGHDIDTDTTPVEADLMWSVPKRRRDAGDFPGAEKITRQLADGVARQRVGILPDGRAPAREGTQIQDRQGSLIGSVTSGGFAPSLGQPVAMGYVAASHAAPGTEIHLIVRGKALPAKIAEMPFVPQRYWKG